MGGIIGMWRTLCCALDVVFTAANGAEMTGYGATKG